MEPFSVAAAAITLGPLVFQTARQLRSVAKSIKYARSELEDLTDEMSMFSIFYDQFMQVTEERMNKTKHAASARKRLVSWAESAKYDFKKLSRRVDALSRDPIYEHSVTETVSAHCKWYFNKSNLKYLRYTLVVARQSMVGFTHMCNIEILNDILARLRSGTTSDQRAKIEQEQGVTLEQYIILLKAKKKQLRKQTTFTNDIAQEAIKKISSRQSRSQNEDYSTHTEQLLSFSRTVDRQIERTLHPTRSSEKRSQSHSSSRPDAGISPDSGSNTGSNSRTSSNSNSDPSSLSTMGSNRTDSPPYFSTHYVHIQHSQPTVDQMHQGHRRYTRPDIASQKAARLSNEAERTGTNAARQTNEAEKTRIDPNHTPPLSVPGRSNDIHQSRPGTDTNIHVPIEPPRAPKKHRSDSTDGVVGAENGESPGSGRDEEIANDQATFTANTKWRATGPFEGTEPRQIREKREKGL